MPFHAFPVDVRQLLYTTNAIETLNAKLRSAVRTRRLFPTDEVALKLLYLVLHRAEKAWTMPAREWLMAKAQFAVLFGERFTRALAWPVPLQRPSLHEIPDRSHMRHLHRHHGAADQHHLVLQSNWYASNGARLSGTKARADTAALARCQPHA